MSCSNINFNVSVIFAVFELSGFCSVVHVTVFCVFPEASLYTSFNGLLGDVLQYCFHEFIFSSIIAAWYYFFPSMYLFFLFSFSSLLFGVRWCLLLSAFVLLFWFVFVFIYVHLIQERATVIISIHNAVRYKISSGQELTEIYNLSQYRIS
jgi:hypothetical protein